MFRGIKRIVAMNKEVEKSVEQRDENGLLLLNMTVLDDSNFISPFSYHEAQTLSEDASNFLDKALKPARYKEDIHLQIHSNVIDDEEKQVYAQAIKTHYYECYIAEKQNIKRDVILAAFMLLAGVAFLALMLLANHFWSSAITNEILDIIAWVFMWEAADIFFLERKVSTWKQQRNISLCKAKITFLPLATKKN
ncbi:MAG: hypothetical protein RR416_01320 [Clostridia bacterium]